MSWASILRRMYRSGERMNQAAHQGSGQVTSQGLLFALNAGHSRMTWSPWSNPVACLDPGLGSQGKGKRRPPPL
jgi:hypothetical protein